MLTAAVASADVRSSGSMRACLEQTGLVHSVLEWAVSPEQHPGTGRCRARRCSVRFCQPDGRRVQLRVAPSETAPHSLYHCLFPSKQPSPDLLIKAMRSGVQEFLPLPLDPAMLKEALTRFIEARGERTPARLRS